ncbi:B3 domain-containing protein-like protein [Salvia divinorum]|uniref:B3 domain-containing protein-like protein n=1 Tax=Salvia divinorum TaxID=28513 RepID=A0ABD1I5L0_SALDI
MAEPPQPGLEEGDTDDAYPKKPSFIKFFSMKTTIDCLRLPPEFIVDHGNTLPFHCRLVLPNGRSWKVVLLNIASGCHFQIEWSDFVRDNDIRHGGTLTFTLVSDGIFDVKPYGVGSGCPPRGDIEVLNSDVESDEPYSPDVATSEDYEPSEIDSEAHSDCSIDVSALALADYEHPTFMVVLTESSIKKSSKISIEFGRQHIRTSALEDPIHFTIES